MSKFLDNHPKLASAFAAVAKDTRRDLIVDGVIIGGCSAVFAAMGTITLPMVAGLAVGCVGMDIVKRAYRVVKALKNG